MKISFHKHGKLGKGLDEKAPPGWNRVPSQSGLTRRVMLCFGFFKFYYVFIYFASSQIQHNGEREEERENSFCQYATVDISVLRE